MVGSSEEVTKKLESGTAAKCGGGDCATKFGGGGTVRRGE